MTPTRPLKNPIASLVPEFANDNACIGESRRQKIALQRGPFPCGASRTAMHV